MYVAVTIDEDNDADGLFQQPAQGKKKPTPWKGLVA